MDMTKNNVKRALGIESDAELGRYLGISRGAVWFWGGDEPIPDVRQWQLRALRPDLFGPAGELLPEYAVSRPKERAA